MNWNPELFSKTGYLGLVFSGLVLLLWVVYLWKPNRVMSLAALVLACFAFVFARTNSSGHINRIQPDRTEEVAKRAAQEQARKNALLDSRGDEVAKIRFAEDGANDFLDRAGMDEEDLKYFESQGGFGDAEWKKEKKTRSKGASDEGLESELGGDSVIGGVQSDEFATDEEDEPIIMSEADLVMAHRLDFLNLRSTLFLVVIACLVALYDYLRRANIYGKASRPLPLPSSWLNALTPISPLVVSSKRCRKSARSELARLVKRGDSFLYLTDASSRVSKLPSSMSKLPIFGKPEELLRVDDHQDADFIFETVWNGRSSFVSGDPEKSRQLLGDFLDRLEIRSKSRAKVSQIAHLVWDYEKPMAAAEKEKVVRLAAATGLSFLIIRGKTPKSSQPKSAQANPESTPIPS